MESFQQQQQPTQPQWNTNNDKKLIYKFLHLDLFLVLGASEDESKFGHKVFKTLLDKHRNVMPVNPHCESVCGRKTAKSVKDVGDISRSGIIIVTPPDATKTILNDVKEAGGKWVWCQPGSEFQGIVNFCEENNIHLLCGGYDIMTALERKEQNVEEQRKNVPSQEKMERGKYEPDHLRMEESHQQHQQQQQQQHPHQQQRQQPLDQHRHGKEERSRAQLGSQSEPEGVPYGEFNMPLRENAPAGAGATAAAMTQRPPGDVPKDVGLPPCKGHLETHENWEEGERAREANNDLLGNQQRNRMDVEQGFPTRGGASSMGHSQLPTEGQMQRGLNECGMPQQQQQQRWQENAGQSEVASQPHSRGLRTGMWENEETGGGGIANLGTEATPPQGSSAHSEQGSHVLKREHEQGRGIQQGSVKGSLQGHVQGIESANDRKEAQWEQQQKQHSQQTQHQQTQHQSSNRGGAADLIPRMPPKNEERSGNEETQRSRQSQQQQQRQSNLGEEYMLASDKFEGQGELDTSSQPTVENLIGTKTNPNDDQDADAGRRRSERRNARVQQLRGA